MLKLLVTLLVSATVFVAVYSRAVKMDRPGELVNLDGGLQNQFVIVTAVGGVTYTGQVVGVYNEALFFWNPTIHSTISIFTSTNSKATLNDFSTTPGDDPAIFSLNSIDISTIEIVWQPAGYVEYNDYMRTNGHVFTQPPVDGETWISRGWDAYHLWEDGRGNYAWDIGALNDNMMSYSGYGNRNNNYEVWGRNTRLPMAGTVVTAVEKEVDNVPDIVAAVDMEDAADGQEVQLDEKPQNMIELRVGGDNSRFLLRIIHLKQNSIPNNIRVGRDYPAGTLVGTVGNSGTTLVPHLHVVWGFTDANDRFWSLPIEWQNYNHRILLAYPTGYQYGQYHHHAYGYPKKGQCISN